MAPIQNLVQRAFAGGEITPGMAARADLVRYTQALKTCRNFVVRRSGGLSNRAGFQYIATTKSGADNLVHLFKWSFTAASQSTLIEAGDGYFRFYQGGVQLTVSGVDAYDSGDSYVPGDLVSDGGVNYYCVAAASPGDAPPDTDFWYALEGNIYEIPTPYDADAFNSPGPLRFAQNGAELTITHQVYAPRILKNNNLLGTGNPNWTLEPLSTAPSLDAPGSFAVVNGAAGSLNPRYVVTAVKAETYEESLASTPDDATASADPTDVAPNTMSWGAVTGAAEYRVYKDPLGNGTFGYIGTATGQLTFADSGFTPDFARTPPQARVLFASTDNYPEVGGYYQQRRVLASTSNEPWTFWLSRTGYQNNFSIRSPLQDDDAITVTIAGTDFQVIRHVIRLPRLMLLTEGGEWLAHGDETGALTPAAVNLQQHGYNGAHRALPAIVGSAVVYVQARGSRVRVAKFDDEVNLSITAGDLTIVAGHLFEDYTLSRLEYQQSPHSIVWAVRSDGTLLGLTYLPEDEIFGWHRHDTLNGLFEDICVVPESTGDVLYAIVNRTIDGSTVRYIEKLAARPEEFTDATLISSAIFLDCAKTKTGGSSAVVAGLSHLEGEEVYALADGLVQGPFTVVGGAITMTTAASTVHVGKRITADLETCALDAQGTGARDKRKRVQALGLVLQASRAGFSTGPDTDHLYPYKRESFENNDAVFSGFVDPSLTASFTEHGRVVVRQLQPLPLTILAAIPQFEVGG